MGGRGEREKRELNWEGWVETQWVPRKRETGEQGGGAGGCGEGGRWCFWVWGGFDGGWRIGGEGLGGGSFFYFVR